MKECGYDETFGAVSFQPSIRARALKSARRRISSRQQAAGNRLLNHPNSRIHPLPVFIKIITAPNLFQAAHNTTSEIKYLTP
jgi:hypothetical protein